MSPRKTKTTKKTKAKVPEPTGVPNPQALVPVEDRAGANAAFISEEYNKVARAAKLEGLVLIGSSFEAKAKPNFLSERKPDDSNVKYTFNSKASDFAFDDADGVAKCAWMWTLAAIIDEEESISITATYHVFYSNLVDCDLDAITRFMKRVGRFATYPYFRAHVSQISWESSTNLPLLPTISS